MPAKTLATLALAALLTATASAETLLLPTNNGFETDTFSVAPGYVSGNFPITGWTASDNGRVGLNPTTAPSSDFANNGLVPEGSQVAFIQSGGPAVTLSQDVSGFTTGDRYVLWYRENSRSGYAVPTVSASLDVTTVVGGHAVPAVGAGNAYRTSIGTPFTATSGTHTLTFSAAAAPDGAATIDDVRLYGYAADEIIVLNSSFEWDSFGTNPGYSSGAANGPISGWTSTNSDRTGINPSAGSPFADNGAVPDGSQVAFIQNFTDGSTGTLSQTVNGLTIGETYRVDVRLNSRSTGTGQVLVSMGGDDLWTALNAGPVGGTNPYHAYSFLRVAESTSETLTFANVAAAGDNTLLLDTVAVTAAPTWTASAWTGDGDSGIVGGNAAYSHAVNFGSSTGALVNGVGFTGNPNINPSDVTYSLTGYGDGPLGDANNLTGGGDGSATLASSFIYGGNPGTLTLTGLIAGSTNVLTFYGIGWDATEARNGIFTDTGTGASFVIDENQYGNNGGIKVQYTYTADASGNAVVTVAPELAANTFHLYAMANQALGYRNLFTDNYNVVAASNDINPTGNDEPGRQTGAYAELNYAENVGGTDNFTQMSNPGAGADRLFLATQSGVLGYTAVSPNGNFVVEQPGVTRYQIMFDVNPANAENVGTDVDTTDWASIVFGASTQNAFVAGSDGIGILIRGNGGFEIWDGSDGSNGVAASGDLGALGIDENDWYHVRIQFDIDAFDDLALGVVSLYVDEVFVTSFTSSGGFAGNFITLGGNNSAGNILVHGFDNLQVWVQVPAPAALPAGLALLLTLAARRRR